MVSKLFSVKKNLKLVVILVLFVSIYLHSENLALALDEDKITDKYPSTDIQPVEVDEALKARQAEQAASTSYQQDESRLKYYPFIDVRQGYDNNVELDPNRYKDGFFQLLSVNDLYYEVNDNFKLKAGCDIFNTLYYTHNINNILDITPYVGFEWYIRPDLKWRTWCSMDYFSYPNQKENSFTGFEARTYLRHYFERNFYQEIGYEYLKRWYNDRKISLETAAEGTEDRADVINKLKYSIAAFFADKFIVKLSGELYRNDSNDIYQEYYDYWVFRGRPSVMYFITDKFYTDASFIYKYRKFKDRRSTENSGETVKEMTNIYSISFYYDIIENFTLGVSYSYTQNYPNDPYYKYSDSIVSAGFYFTF